MCSAPGSVLSALMGSDANDCSCGRGGDMAGGDGLSGLLRTAAREGDGARGERERGRLDDQEGEAKEKEVDATYDGPLLSHLVGAVIEIGLDDARLEFMFCDFIASSRKPKSHSSKKTQEGKVSHHNLSFHMRGIFWNSRGLSDLAKHKHIDNCVREHGLDFVAIFEADKM